MRKIQFAFIFGFVFGIYLNTLVKASVLPSLCDDIPPQDPSCHIATSRSVSLYIAGTGDQVRVGETSDLSSLPWVNYTNPYPYTFSSGGGIKTLYADVKEHISGQITNLSAQFIVDLAEPTGYIIISPSTTYDSRTMQVTIYFYDYYEYGEQETPMLDGSFKIGHSSNLSDGNWQSITNGEKVISFEINPDECPEGRSIQYPIYYQFKDAAGLTSDIHQQSVAIDKTPPTIYAGNPSHPNTLEIYTSDTSGISKLYIAKEKDYMQFYMDYDDYYKLTHHYSASIPSTFITINNPRSTENVNMSFTNDDSRVIFVMALDGVGNYEEYLTYMSDGTSKPTPILPTKIPVVSGSVTPIISPSISTSITPSALVTDNTSFIPSITDNSLEAVNNTNLVAVGLFTTGALIVTGASAAGVVYFNNQTHFINKLFSKKKLVSK